MLVASLGGEQRTHLEHLQKGKNNTQVGDSVWYTFFPSFEWPTTNKSMSQVIIYLKSTLNASWSTCLGEVGGLSRWRTNHLEHFQKEKINTLVGDRSECLTHRFFIPRVVNNN